MSPTVELRQLTLRIPTRVKGRAAWVHAATGVDLVLQPGRVHALVGETGCGKSVLASALSGLLPAGTRVQGNVLIDGEDLTGVLGRPRDARWRRVRGRPVGVVSQSAATSFTPTRTLGAQLGELVRELGARVDVHQLCEEARFPAEALSAHPHELSGGMVQRAALAAALVGDPAVLVADEPTSALDRELGLQTLALLRERADRGSAVLLITHDLASLLDAGIADEVSVMYAGRIVEHGSAEQVLARPSHAYPQALLAALPRNGLHPVPGEPPSLVDLTEDVRFEDRLAPAPEGGLR